MKPKEKVRLVHFRHSCRSTTSVEAVREVAPNNVERPQACPGACKGPDAVWTIVGESVLSQEA